MIERVKIEVKEEVNIPAEVNKNALNAIEIKKTPECKALGIKSQEPSNQSPWKYNMQIKNAQIVI